MYETLSWITRFILIILIYLFIYRIVHLIYLDIKSMYSPVSSVKPRPYLKLINILDHLNFPVKEIYILDKDEITIGRKNKNHIIIPDPYLSSEHAKISTDNGNYYIEDLGSSNGTYLNGSKVVRSTVLNDGDKIDLGQLSFVFVNMQK